jgi:hypothetical protein
METRSERARQRAVRAHIAAQFEAQRDRLQARLDRLQAQRDQQLQSELLRRTQDINPPQPQQQPDNTREALYAQTQNRRQARQTCDVVFSFPSGDKVYASREVLMTSSAHFNGMFTNNGNGMVEARNRSYFEVQIQDDNIDMFRLYIKYLYLENSLFELGGDIRNCIVYEHGNAKYNLYTIYNFMKICAKYDSIEAVDKCISVILVYMQRCSENAIVVMVTAYGSGIKAEIIWQYASYVFRNATADEKRIFKEFIVDPLEDNEDNNKLYLQLLEEALDI